MRKNKKVDNVFIDCSDAQFISMGTDGVLSTLFISQAVEKFSIFGL